MSTPLTPPKSAPIRWWLAARIGLDVAIAAALSVAFLALWSANETEIWAVLTDRDRFLRLVPIVVVALVIARLGMNIVRRIAAARRAEQEIHHLGAVGAHSGSGAVGGSGTTGRDRDE